MRVAAEVAERLGLPHPLSLAAAVAATDKRVQRAAFAEAGVPQPALLRADAPFDRPVVVKPSLAQGQRGLTRVERAEDLAPALERAREQSRDGEALVEELIDGDEVTVNAFLHDGFHAIAVTDRERASAFGVATAHLFPAACRHRRGDRRGALRCAALGIERGPVYVQIVLAPGGPRVMEVAARLGGATTPSSAWPRPASTWPAWHCSAALGERISALRALAQPAAGRDRALPDRGHRASLSRSRASRGPAGAGRARRAVLPRGPASGSRALAVGADRVGFVLAEGRPRGRRVGGRARGRTRPLPDAGARLMRRLLSPSPSC